MLYYYKLIKTWNSLGTFSIMLHYNITYVLYYIFCILINMLKASLAIISYLLFQPAGSLEYQGELVAFRKDILLCFLFLAPEIYSLLLLLPLPLLLSPVHGYFAPVHKKLSRGTASHTFEDSNYFVRQHHFPLNHWSWKLEELCLQKMSSDMCLPQALSLVLKIFLPGNIKHQKQQDKAKLSSTETILNSEKYLSATAVLEK